MFSFVIRRLIAVFITLIVVSILTFYLMHIAPGNPFISEKGLDPEVLKALNERYGLSDSLPKQYLNYINGLLHWDFGVSFKLKGITVNRMLNDGIKPTALIGLYGGILIAGIGVPLGIISALKHNKFVDRFSMFISVIGVTIPGFVFATLYLYIFSVKLNWAPTFGVGSFKHYIGPALCISFFSLAFVTRLTRTSMIEVLQQDYIRTARAKGLSNFKVLYKHALRNALIPVVTYIGPMVAAILTGSFVIEKVFSIPGIGSYYTESVSNRDYTLIMGMTMFYAVFLVIAVFIVDILYALIDPRIKFEK